MIKHCYIRVDANKTIGTGHLIRTLILADKLVKNNFIISFICKTIPNSLIEVLQNKNYTLYRIDSDGNEFNEITSIIENKSNSILITDSDNEEFYTKEFQIKIREKSIKLMMITFYYQHHFYADIILNQNIMALSQEYSCEDYTIKLLGPQNVILKEDYRTISKDLDQYKTKLKNKTLLLTFGGVDEPDRTSFIYQALQNIKNQSDKIIIVLGSMYKFKSKIENIAKTSLIDTEIYQNTSKMPYLLAEADIVFNSGGLTVWESGVLKSTNIIMGFSKREQIGGQYIGDNKLGIYLGSKDDYTINSLSDKIDSILENYNNQFINNLYSKIDVNGIENAVQKIKSL